MSAEEVDPIDNPRTSIFASEAEKIRQSVMIGSVFLALEKEFFTANSLMRWLAEAEVNEQTNIAYKLVCIKIHPNHQYLEDGFHFLTKRPQYSVIAAAIGLNVEIPSIRNIEGSSEDIPPVLVYIVEELSDNLNKQRIRKLISLILVGTGSTDYIRDHLITCYRARNFPHIRNMTSYEYNSNLIHADWIEKFRYNDRLAKLILERVVFLQKEAPMYYVKVAYSKYHEVVTKLNQDKLLIALNQDELIMLNTFFPNIVDSRIFGYDSVAYKLSLYNNAVSGYILGFPIQNQIPNDAQIHTAISMLMEMGATKYAEYIKNWVKQTYTPALPIECGKIVYPNETDVLMEEIDNYAPFDIVVYQDGIYIYRFSRAELDKLLEHKKNPWTNDWLPATVLSTLRNRSESAKEIGLPPCRPISEMLERIEKGTLFETDEQSLASVNSEPELTPLQAAISAFVTNSFQSSITTDDVMESGEEDSVEY